MYRRVVTTLTATYNHVGFSYPARAVILYPAAQNYYIVQDKLGSVHGLFQRDGTWRAGVRFNPYGDLVALDSAGPKPPIWYSWTGREFDEETGWYYHRARYYSPLVRRFVQEDPVGYDGGVNLYAYVEGKALEATDPSGTRTSENTNGRGGGGGGTGGITWGGNRSMMGLGGGFGGGSVYIDGVPVASGASFLGLPGLQLAPSSGFYSPYSNVPRGSVFQSDGIVERNRTASQNGAFTAFAPAYKWGDWKEIATHFNSVNYTIEVKRFSQLPAAITGEVRYWSGLREGTSQLFAVEIRIKTYGAGNVYVRFKTSGPFPSSVMGRIYPGAPARCCK